MTASWSREQLHAMLEHSTDIIILVEETGDISYVNSRAEAMLGYEPEQMVGENAFGFIHEADRLEVFERFIDLIESPGTSTDRVQHRMVDKAGDSIWVESVGSNRTNTQLDGYVINTRDIREIKEYEAELKRQNERLEEFASVVSHDIRNPLNVARGRLDLAKSESESPHLAPIEEALERIEAIIEDVLTLSRAGKFVGEKERVDLASVAKTCWENVDTQTAELVIESDRTLRADESRLRQLLENLIANSVEHGGGEVTVTIGDHTDGFYIADDGVGLRPEHRGKLFEPGYSTGDGGTGFGLTIVNQIAEAHGWNVTADQSDAGGARFLIQKVTDE
jgi:PAS domain S-box-containing protein